MLWPRQGPREPFMTYPITGLIDSLTSETVFYMQFSMTTSLTSFNPCHNSRSPITESVTEVPVLQKRKLRLQRGE